MSPALPAAGDFSVKMIGKPSKELGTPVTAEPHRYEGLPVGPFMVRRSDISDCDATHTPRPEGRNFSSMFTRSSYFTLMSVWPRATPMVAPAFSTPKGC